MIYDSLVEARRRWSDGVYAWTETDDETYYAMLGAVAPLRRDGGDFICGETYDNTRDGHDVHYVFVVTDGPAGRKYWVRLWTEREYIFWRHNGRELKSHAVKVVTLSPDGTPSQN